MYVCSYFCLSAVRYLLCFFRHLVCVISLARYVFL